MKAETRVGLFIISAIAIFIYLSINIGSLRLDRAQYNTYKTYFDDTGGLDVNAFIKIAGVNVGWVDSIELLPDGRAEIIMKVSKDIKLAKNSYAMITQEGLIGTKTLVLEPGDPSTGFLLPGSILSMPGKSPATVSDLLDQFKDIASSIQDIAFSFRSVFATPEGEIDMKNALSGIARASNKMADFSEVLDRTIRKNEDNLNASIIDLKYTMHHLQEAIPSIQDNFNQTFPSIKKDANRLTLAFADDTLPKVSDASQKVGTAFITIDDTAVQARETFREAEEVVEKINTGKGVLGKLINEDETYDDIKKTIRGLKEYVVKAQSFIIDIDMHSELLLARDWNSKGYLDIKLRPTLDYFYQFQIVTDERGNYLRQEEQREWFDQEGKELEVDKLNYGNNEFGNAQKAHDRLEFSKTIDKTVRTKNDMSFGFQFGKRFNRFALRIGLFENTFGMACDIYVPLYTDKFHWISSVEAFDFRGTKHADYGTSYSRPYIRWINKLFFLRNIYTVIGFDDIMGRKTAGPTWGGGVRFNDDDLKYIISMFPAGKLTGK
ncbi:MCE family protein [Candidatus Dependentiae bacterium]|nr:MCE family protein [Candidatus Dependentiae bacterium]